MRLIRTQATIAILGLVLVGALLYSQSLGLVVSFSPARGGTFVEGVVGTPHELNPLLFSTIQADSDIVRLVYAGIMRLDSNGHPVPDLAESWAVNADGVSYTFVLRSGLRWHDGVPLSLDDVIFTIGMLQADDYPGPSDVGELWKKISVAKLNATTLKLTLPEPYAPFIDHTTFPVLPAHRFSGIRAGDLSLHPASDSPVGAGPFRIDMLLRNDNGKLLEVLLAANPYYHGIAPMLSRVRLIFFPDEAAAVQALRNGEIMGVGGISHLAMSSLMSERNYNVFSSLLPEYRLIMLNQQNASVSFFQDKKVRQALLSGINRDRIVDVVLSGQAVVASSPILPGTWAFHDQLEQVSYDPIFAEELLQSEFWVLPETTYMDEADYVRNKDGKPLAFELVVPDDARSRELGQMVVDDWARLGIQVTMEASLPDTIQSEYLEPRQFQAIMVHLSLQRAPDPDPYSFWHQTEIESGQNYSGYDNRAVSELLEQARTTPSSAARARLYRSFQARFVDETPTLLLYYPVYSYVVSSSVSGVQLGPLLQPEDRFNSIANWYIIIRRSVGS